MATVTTKSKAAKPSVKAGKAPTGAARDAAAKRDKDMGVTIKTRRAAGEKFGPIASDLKITVGKAIYLYECATVAPKDRIKFTDADDLANKIVAARDKGLSWGRISAYSGVPEGRVRSTWEKATGKSAKGESIGKGGRKANGVVATPKAKAAAKPKAAPKAAAKPAAKPAAAKPAAPQVKRVIKRRVAAS